MKTKDELENCVGCGIKTDVPKSMHIDQRRYYVIGAGQLCPQCYGKIYLNN